MKKIFFCALVLFFSTASFCQVRFGIKAGLNVANQRLTASEFGNTGSESGSAIPSFHVGGFADIPISPKASFVPELLFSGKGSDFAGTDLTTGNPTTAKFRPYYLDVPLNFVYRKRIQNDGTFFIGGGPQFGIGLFGKLSTADSSADIFQVGSLTKFDFGINLISGIELKSGLRFSINYTAGVMSILDTGGAQNPYNESFYNNVFGFSIGYIFNKH